MYGSQLQQALENDDRQKMSKTELTHLAGISTNAMAKLGKNEDVRVNILEKLCTSLDCKLDDIVEFVPDSKE